MKGLYRRHCFSLLCAAGLLLGGSLLGTASIAIAQGTVRLRLPNISAPGNRESGSTRSTTCIAANDNLVALVPETNYGLTEKAYPTFYFYVPTTAASQVKFVMLNDATNELVYEGRFSLQSNAGGIASVSLPENGLQQPLEVEQTYVWYLAVVCDAADPSADVVVEGYVQRVAPLVGAAETELPALPALYASEGLWYDALAASAQLKANNSTSEWNTLLDAVELNELIPLPLLSEDLPPMGSGESSLLPDQ